MKYFIPDIAIVGKGFIIESKAQAELTSIPAVINSIETLGYTEGGDGGGAIYNRALAGPASNELFQDASGAWWQLQYVYPLKVKQFGAVGDGVTDDSAAIQLCVDKTGTIVFENGDFVVSNNILVKSNTNIVFTPDAKIMAGANGVIVFYSTNVDSCYGSKFYNVSIDGNGKTGVIAFDLYNFRLNAAIYDPYMTGIDTGIIFRYGCFGAEIHNPTTFDNVPNPIVIMDNCAEAKIFNPQLDNSGNVYGSSKGIDIQIGGTVGACIGLSIEGGYIQGFNQGVVDTGVGTLIRGTYFERCQSNDILANGAQNPTYIGTQHWAGIGGSAIAGANSDGVFILNPVMGSGNRSIGLLDFDNTNTNGLYIASKSDTFKNTPIGVIDGLTFSIKENNILSANVTGSNGFVSTSDQIAALPTGTPTTIISFDPSARGKYEIVAMVPSSGSAAGYTAFATVIWDGSQARLSANNGANLSITLSGSDVQIEQTSGADQLVFWSSLYQNALAV